MYIEFFQQIDIAGNKRTFCNDTYRHAKIDTYLKALTR